MSDAKLRELERRWEESGAVENEVAYLLERVRVGDLEREKLELAAYCNHPAARLALGDEAPAVPADLEEWARRFASRRAAFVRACIAAARRALEWTSPDDAITVPAERCLRAAEGWALEPSQRTEDRCRQAAAEGQEALPVAIRRGAGPARTTALLACIRTAEHAAGRRAGHDRPAVAAALRAVRVAGVESPRDLPAELARDVLCAGLEPPALEHALEAVRQRLAQQAPTAAAALAFAARAELVPWLLGRGDPVRDRCARPG